MAARDQVCGMGVAGGRCFSIRCVAESESKEGGAGEVVVREVRINNERAILMGDPV